MHLKKYKVGYCPKCKKLQITSAKLLSCKYCQRHTKIRQKNKFGLAINIIASFDTPKQANRFIVLYQNEIMKNKFIGFREFGAKMSEKSEELNHLREDEAYLVGTCAICKSQIMSNQRWKIEKGKPTHYDCSIEEEIEIGQEFDKTIKDMGVK